MAKWRIFIADPKGKFMSEPLIEKEGIFYTDIGFMTAIEERQNFDYSFNGFMTHVKM